MTKILEAARRLVSDGGRGVMATLVAGEGSGTAALLDPVGSIIAGDEVPAEVREALARIDARGVPENVAVADAVWFVEPVVPAPRLIVLGAISVADALVPMAAAAGYDVTLIDTREWLARPERYPTATAVLCGTPVERLTEVGIDGATSIVSLLHEARLEDEVLTTALRSPARYVGSMGSGKSTSAKRDRLTASGLAPEELERLHAPIGLSLGSRTPQEIAVSVLAQVVAAGRGVA